MHFPEGVIIPRHGVYAAKVYLEGGESYVAVTNVGIRPTVANGNSVTVESHLLDYSGNLYGRQARVEFYKFLRPADPAGLLPPPAPGEEVFRI